MASAALSGRLWAFPIQDAGSHAIGLRYSPRRTSVHNHAERSAQLCAGPRSCCHCGAFFGISGGVSADPPPPIFPHQHFIVQPDGSLLAVGPDVCANPAAEQGFFGFHQNVHLGAPNQTAFQEPNNPVGFMAVPRC